MKRKIILFLLSFFTVGFSFSQHSTTHLWTKIHDYRLQGGKDSEVTGEIEVDRYKLDIDELRRVLMNVPFRRTTHVSRLQMSDSKVVISFPSASGEMESYRIIETPVFHPDLSARYPDIKSYKGIGIEDPTSVIGFSLSSEKGFSSMVLYGTARSVFIEPHDLSQSIYNVFRENKRKKFECFTKADAIQKSLKENLDQPIVDFANDQRLRIYRIVVSTNSEYTTYHGGTKAGALAAINTTLTRVNLIFERDLAVFLQLIPNNEDVIFMDPETDPYDDNRSSLNNQLQEILTNTIGEANYDVGHLFFGVTRREVSGNAGYIGCVCVDKIKGSGFTKGGPPESYAFDIVVTHELGHQFGARHTFTHRIELGSIAQLEPGSGSTIMGYAGITSRLTDVQDRNDDYFHFISINQITDYISTTTCGKQTVLANSPPTVNAGDDYIIPHTTAFVLRGTGIDPDAEDVLTYCWEQADLGHFRFGLPNPSNLRGPLFRSFLPSISPNRYMPALNSVLEGKLTTKWETVSSLPRDLNFSLTVRDNVLGGGQTANDKMVVTVNKDTGPFRVTSQNTTETWYAGSNQRITWDIANTNTLPVNCENVNILLTTDRGGTFITLAANTPNDSSEMVTVPMSVNTTTQGRIWVEAANNIFYAVNSSDITIEKSPFRMLFDDFTQTTCDGKEAVYVFDYLTDGDFNETTVFSASDLPEGTTATFDPTSTSENNTTVKMTISNPAGFMFGHYDIKVTGETPSGEKRETIVELNAATSSLEDIFLILPVSSENINLGAPVSLTWTENSNAEEYIVEIATDTNFNNIVETSRIVTPFYKTKNIKNTDVPIRYYWRVKARNSCGESTYSQSHTFKLGQIFCERKYISNDVGQTFSFFEPLIESRLNIPSSDLTGYIMDVNVTVDIMHTFDDDVKIVLVSPNKTEILLNELNGLNGDNFTNTTFDDDADVSINDGTPPFTGTFSPIVPLSFLNGERVEGDWKLLVSHTRRSIEFGKLNGWNLDICITPDYRFWLNNTLSSSENVCLPNDEEVTLEFAYKTYGIGFSEKTVFSAIGLPDGVMASFNPKTTIHDTTIQLVLNNLDKLSEGNYSFDVVGKSTTLADTLELKLNIYDDVFETVALQTPSNGAFVEDHIIAHLWRDVGDTYEIQIATDVDFENIVEEDTVSTNTYITKNIGFTGNTYYWRVRLVNLCHKGEFSEPYSYIREDKNCNIYHSTDVPKDIDMVGTVISNINSDSDFVKDENTDITVTLDITHSWVQDLIVRLVSPQQDTIILVENIGFDGDNFTNTTFDDNALVSINDGLPPFTGIFTPHESFSNFDGENLKGDWHLLIEDVNLTNGETGILNSWYMVICQSVDVAVLDIYVEGEKCDTSKAIVKTRIANNSSHDLTNIPIVLNVSEKTPLTRTDTLHFLEGSRDTIIILDTLNIQQMINENVALTVYSNIPHDDVPANDTVSKTFYISSNQFPPTLPETTTFVFVGDSIRPVVKCKDIRRYISKSENVSILPAEIDDGSTDNCGIDTMSLLLDNFTCEDIGDNEVAMIVVDDFENFDICIANVELLPKRDTIFQSINTNEASVICVDEVTDFFENDYFVGICTFPLRGTAILNEDQCVEYTGNERFVEGRDEICIVACNPGDVCDTTIVIVEADISRPVAECKDIRKYISGSETVSILPSEIDDGSSSEHSIDTMYLDINSFTCENIGDNEVMLTVEDTLGNKQSCMATVELLPKQDTIFQSINTNETSVICVDEVTDFCGNDYFVGICAFPLRGAAILNEDQCVEYTGNERFVEGKDEICIVACNPGDVCDTTIVIVEADISRPVAECKDIRKYISGSETVSILPSEIDDGSSSEHGIDTMYLDINSFTCENIGNNEVMLTVEDTLGNKQSCMATVELLPKQDTIFQSINTNETSVICVDEVTDFCGNDYFVGICAFPLRGAAILNEDQCVEYTGNERFVEGKDEICIVACNPGDVCDTTIVIVEADISRPVAECKDIRKYISGSETVSILPSEIDDGSSSEHGIDTMYLDINSFTCENIGDNEVMLTVEDTLGNKQSCMATVELLPKRDTIFQSINTTEASVICVDEVTDFCENDYFVGICTFPLRGTAILNEDQCVEYTGNERFVEGRDEICIVACNPGDVCDTTIVIVEADISRPVAECKDIRKYISGSETVSILPSEIDDGSSSEHGIDTMYLDINSFTCENIGDNEVMLTVEDTLGNKQSCMATVELLPKRDTIFQSINTTEASVICVDEVTDFCENDYFVGICTFPLRGTAILNEDQCVEYTGNERFVEGRDEICIVACNPGDVCDTTIVIVEADISRPVAECKDIRKYISGSETVSILPSEIDDGSSSEHGIDTMYLDINSFTCENIGNNEVMLTVEDTLGNKQSCMATVELLPKQDTIFQSINTTEASVICVDEVTDFCGNDYFVGICAFPLRGAAILNEDQCVEYTGNERFVEGKDEICIVACNPGDVCDTTIVIVEADISRPVAECKDIRKYISGSETVSILPSEIDDGSSSEHGIDTMYLDINSFTCENIGDNEVMLTVEDTLGNKQSCMATVELLPKRDTIFQSINTNETSVICVDEVTDFCGNDYFVGICAFPLRGAAILNEDQCVEYTGNERFVEGKDEICIVACNPGDVCDTTIVIVEADISRPVAECKDIRKYISGSETVSILPSEIDDGSSSEHGIDTMYLDINSFTCENIGDNEVMLTVEDTLGNKQSCMATVELLPKRDTIFQSINTNETSVICVDEVTDFCGNDYFVGICAFPLRGAAILNEDQCVEYTGNERFVEGKDEICIVACNPGDVCDTTIVIVEADISRPVAECKDIRKYISGSETVSILPSEIDDGSSSEHGIDTMYLDINSFTCENIGNNEVMLTVEDTLGNKQSCMATVELLPKQDTIFQSINTNETSVICVDEVTDFCGNDYFVGICAFPLRGTAILNEDQCVEYTGNERFVEGRDEICIVACNPGDVCDTTIVIVEADISRPIAECKDIRKYISGSETVSILPSEIDDGSSSEHGIDTMYLDINSFTCENIGNNEVMLTVEDTLGNKQSCMATVELLPKQDTIFQSINTNETSVICVDEVTDFCGNDYFVGICTFPLRGAAILNEDQCVEYTGNERFVEGRDEICIVACNPGDVCDTTIVIVEADISRPIAECKDIRKYISGSETVSILPSEIDDGSSSEHGIDTMYLDINSFTCENIGNNEVMLTVEDTLGNKQSCMATVELLPKQDTIFQSINTNETSVICVDEVTDFCGNDYFVGICTFPLRGAAILNEDQCVEYTGNERFVEGKDEICIVACNPGDVCDTTIVIVEADISRPVAECKDIRKYISGSETVSILPSEIDDGSSSEHGIDTMYLDINSFTCENIGDNEVMLTVEDTLGNKQSCMATVELLPKRDTIFQSINTTEASVICVDEVTDFCENDYFVGICTFPLRGTAILNEDQCVEYTGNERFVEGRDEICIVACNPGDVCDTTIVIVEADISRPVAECKDIRKYISGSETVSILPSEIDDGSSSEHGIDTMYLDINSFTCENIGNNEVMLTVEDTLGNKQSCMATVELLPKQDTIFQSINTNETSVICVDEVTDFCENDYNVGICTFPLRGTAILNEDQCVEYTGNERFVEGKDEICIVACNPGDVCDTTIVIVEADCNSDISKMFIPQLLTPNDDGANERWKIPYLTYGDLCYEKNKVVIFNRGGQKILSKENYGREGEYWDGRYKGKKVPSGTYYYYIIIDGDKDNARTGYIHVQW